MATRPSETAGTVDGVIALPVVEETLRVDTRIVDAATVRVRKTVEAQEIEVSVPLERRSADIERVLVNRIVDEIEPARREGDVTVVPVYEEVLVKRWLLKEELRISLVGHVEPSDPVRAVLRRERVEVVRTPVADPERPHAAGATASSTHATTDPSTP